MNGYEISSDRACSSAAGRVLRRHPPVAEGEAAVGDLALLGAVLHGGGHDAADHQSAEEPGVRRVQTETAWRRDNRQISTPTDTGR